MKIIYKYTNSSLLAILMVLVIINSSCKKFIEVDAPSTSVNEGNIYADNGTAAASLSGIYAKMSATFFTMNFTVYPELYADNLALFNSTNIPYTKFYQNNVNASEPGDVPKFWNTIYPFIFNANAAIIGLNASETLTPAVKQNLLGEAYFLRAFYYFYLVAFYGDVPLALTKDYTVNNAISRTAEAQVYQQILSDLKQAQTLLPEGYLKSDALTPYPIGEEERVRPNKSAATALLSRVYLYLKDYANAEAAATEVINKSALYSASIPLNEVFLKNSKETIWALQVVKANNNTDEANQFILQPGGPANFRIIYLADDFMDTFQTGDQRRLNWTGTEFAGTTPYPYAFKYKVVSGPSAITEYPIILRFAEQYLIRAEARIQQNKVAEGIADLNVLRDRAIDKTEPHLENRLKLLATNLSKEAAFIAMMKERRVELFCEWGHRWFDLRRTGQIDAVMGPAAARKGGLWSSFRSILPIPTEEIQFNSKIIQNTGYIN